MSKVRNEIFAECLQGFLRTEYVGHENGHGGMGDIEFICNTTKEFALNPFDHTTSSSGGRVPKKSAILEDRTNYGTKNNLK